MRDRDERIREIAYFLWLEHGSPEGEAERHWFPAAQGLVDSEPSEGEVRDGRGGGKRPQKPFPTAATLGSDSTSEGRAAGIQNLGGLA